MWYGVSMLIKGECENRREEDLLWEERIVLIYESSEEEAISTAKRIGKESECDYETAEGELIHWRFHSIERACQIDGEVKGHGVEVFSRFLRDSEAKSLLRPFPE